MKHGVGMAELDFLITRSGTLLLANAVVASYADQHAAASAAIRHAQDAAATYQLIYEN